MSKEFIRVWRQEDSREIFSHTLIVGESFSDCANCKEIGLDLEKHKACPQCGTRFKFVTSRYAAGGSGERFRWIGRIMQKQPGLVFIDYEDFKRHLDRRNAGDIFS